MHAEIGRYTLITRDNLCVHAEDLPQNCHTLQTGILEKGSYALTVYLPGVFGVHNLGIIGVLRDVNISIIEIGHSNCI